MRIGFIGSGNMAGAIVRGIVAEGSTAAEDVVVTGAHPARAQALARETGVDVVESNEELVEVVGPGGLVVLAVKPQVLPTVLPEIRDALEATGGVAVSIAAGTPLAWLAERLAPGQPIVRVMSNVPARVGAGMSAICGNEHADEQQVDDVVAVFETVGSTVTLAEKDFSAFTALAGSSPAFVFQFVDALARGGVKNGLHKNQAVRIAAQAVLGSAHLVVESLAQGMTPRDLEDTVTSAAGTTVAGTIELDHAGFTSAVLRGVQAVVDRDIAMGAEKD